MAKRQATTQLTHDNWDEPDESPEDPGKFVSASAMELAQRKIRVAKRRLANQEADTSSTGSIFGAFVGFGSKPATSTSVSTKGLFSFGLPSVTTAQMQTSTSLVQSSVSTAFSTSLPITKASLLAPMFPTSLTLSGSANKLPELAEKPKSTESTTLLTTSKTTVTTWPGNVKTTTTESSAEFCSEVKALNESVITWMQENFEENPIVNFAPVFKDYQDHFKQLEEKYGYGPSVNMDKSESQGSIAIPTNEGSVNSNGKSAGSSLVTLGSSGEIETTTAPSTVLPALVSNTNPSSSNTTTSKPFTFGIASSNSSSASSLSSMAAPTLSFGSGGFSFGLKQPEKQAETDPKESADAGDDVEYEPPKPERVEQTEEDALYSIRCKLFYKKEGAFVDKGVGTLFLKPLDGGNKTQLLIRAGTTLGNVLLNLALTDKIPTSRVKNNVSMACVPNPPLDPKSKSNEPVVLFIRVKTEEDAERLLDEINQRKTS